MDPLLSRCSESKCGKSVLYNFIGERRAIKCGKHRIEGMIDVRSRKCSYPKCIKQPCYNFEGTTTGLFCSKHKEDGMINVKGKKCAYSGCKKDPNFNFVGERRGKLCFAHMEKGMVDVKHKKCEHPGCTKRPHFNLENEISGKFCGDHMTPDMVDVGHKKCAYPKCRKRPSFNLKKGIGGKFCDKHKEIGMVNVEKARCLHPECEKSPSFNFEDKAGEFCADHKKPGMINVHAKKCSYPGCEKDPNFNFETEDRGKFCFDHMEKGMIDVKHPPCSHPNCRTRPSYGVPGNRISVCAKHTSEGMCKNSFARCIAEECKEIALFGAYKPVYCKEHKKPEDVDMRLYKCKNCSGLEILNDEGLCFEYCVDSKFYKKRKHHSELKIQNLLKSEIEQQFHLCDKSLDSSCRKRPDIIYDCETHFLAVEIDERQHCSYDKYRELERMKEICRSGKKSVIFIRYNPDKYRGIRVSKEKRELILIEWVKTCLKPISKNEISLSVVYLFYNGFDPSSVKLEEISMA